MGQSKKSGSALRRLSFAVLWRRKGASALLAATAALGVFAAIALHNLIARQEAAIEEMVRTTPIHCVVTTAQGTSSDDLGMISAFVDMLMGLRHQRGCYLDEYVKNVRAKATVPLQQPDDMVLHRILSFDSDRALSAVEGVSVQMLEGWDESVLRTDARVCLVPESLEIQPGPDGQRWVQISMEDGVFLSLQVAGTVSGGPENAIWCPFYLQQQEGISEAFLVESCSFDILDNARLEQCKDAIYETFVEPDLGNTHDSMTFGVMIQDKTYQSTLEEFQSNLSMLRLLLPVLAVLCGGIGFLAGFLSTRGRVREFAVMRCLGMKQWRVFLLVFEEQALLMVLGALAGGVAGFLLEGALSGGALAKAGLSLGVFLAGAAVATGSITRVNVMKLMKMEE